MDIVYGIPSLLVLVVALVYVRRIARRMQEQRLHRKRLKPKYKPPSLTQRSDMRAGENSITVMEEIQRTHSGSPKK